MDRAWNMAPPERRLEPTMASAPEQTAGTRDGSDDGRQQGGRQDDGAAAVALTRITSLFFGPWERF
jgi:hypothetical protein